jgi:hypothetical protein
MGEDFELAKINYEEYCRATGGVSLISGDKLPAFEDLKYEIKQAWQQSAEKLFQEGEKSRGLNYIKLLGFTVEDNSVLLEKRDSLFNSSYEFKYSIVDNYIIVSVNDQKSNDLERVETKAEVFKLDFTFLHRLYEFFYNEDIYFRHDPIFQEELQLFVKEIQEQTK